MSRRRISIEERERSVVVRGWRVGDLLEQAGIKATFSGAVGGWMIDRKRLPDLLAYADVRRVGVNPDKGLSIAETLADAGVRQAHPIAAKDAYSTQTLRDEPLWTDGGDAA